MLRRRRYQPRRLLCRALLLICSFFVVLTVRAQAAGQPDDADPASVAAAAAPAPIAAPAAPALAASTDKILLSIPDAGGLRITISSDNKLHTFIAGKTLPDTPAIPYVGFSADAAGYVNGGSANIGADHILKNLFGTGLDVKILAGTKISASVLITTKASVITMEKGTGGSGGISLLLPLKDSAGNKTELDVPSLTIGRDGTIALRAKAVRATTVNLPGGFSLGAKSLQVDYSHVPGGDDDDAKITLGDVSVQAPIPGVLTGNPAPLTLHVDEATVNTDGQVSFKKANLSQTQAAFLRPVLGTQVASLHNMAAVRPARGARAAAKRLGGFPLRIPLMKPANFVITIQKFDDVSLTMDNNVPTGLTLKCDIDLPSSFSTSTTETKPVTIPGVVLDISSANGFTTTINDVPQAYFKGFGIKIHDAVLDFSETKSGLPPGTPSASAPSGGDVAWEGIYLGMADFTLPESVKLSGETNATPPTLKLSKAWVDNNGFTGDVTLDGSGGKGVLSVEDFAVHLANLAVSVERNSIKKCDISGTLNVKSLGGDITVDAAVADSGLASLHVKTGKLILDDFKAELEIQNGTIQRVADKNDPNKINTYLALTGNWTFTDQAPEAVQGLSIQINDLSIGSDGQFAVDKVWIDLPENTGLDMDVVTLEARQIGFGGIGNGNTPWVGFSGKVGIAGDLPFQAEMDFDGLYIYKGGHIHVGRIGVDVDLHDIVHVTGFIEQTEGTLTHTVVQDPVTHTGISNLNEAGDGYLDANSKVDPAKLMIGGKPLTILTGRVAVALPILGGGSGGPGGELEFLIARNSWYAAGSFSSMTPLIPLGQSGVAIYGFGGGVGYNVKPEFDNATGIPGRDYQIIPDVAAIDATPPPGSLPNIIAMASLRLGSIAAPPPIWGDVTFAVNIKDLTFSVQGNCYLGEPMTPEVPAIASTKSRVLSATLTYDVPNATFTADGYADLCLPEKNLTDINKTLLRVFVPFRFKIGKFDQRDAGFTVSDGRVFYAALGGPVDLGQPTTDDKGVTAHRDVSISNPGTITVRGLQPVKGAVTVDVNKGEFTAALKIHQPFSVDSGGVQNYDLVVPLAGHIAVVKYQYSVKGELDMIGWLQASVASPGGGMSLKDLRASGEFYVSAQLEGWATNLEYSPDHWYYGPDVKVPDLHLKTFVEADISGTITPDSLTVEGQVYADLSVTVGTFSKSFAISKDVTWSSSL